MTKYRNEDNLGNKLREYKPEPPAGLFDRIEQTLREQETAQGKGALAAPPLRKRLRVAYRYAAAAVILAGVALTGTYLIRDTTGVADGEIAVFSEDDFPGQRPSEPMQSASQPYIESEVKVSGGQSRELRAKSSESAGAENLRHGNLLDATGDYMHSALTEKPEERLNGYHYAGDSNSNREKPQLILESTPEEFWAKVVADELNSSKKRNGRTITPSVYASNMGLVQGGDFQSDNISTLAANRLMVREMSGMLNSAESIGGNNYEQYEGALVHKMPLTVGVGVTYPLGDGFYIISGLNYSYLRSEASVSKGAEYNITQKLHYLGIPVGIMYNVYSSRNFNFYVRGGALFEKVIHSDFKLDVATGTGVSAVGNGRMNVKGVQISVDAAAGVNYMFNNTVGLYLEPGIAYYFTNNHQPANYRTVNPTNFSLKLGVRFSL